MFQREPGSPRSESFIRDASVFYTGLTDCCFEVQKRLALFSKLWQELLFIKKTSKEKCKNYVLVLQKRKEALLVLGLLLCVVYLINSLHRMSTATHEILREPKFILFTDGPCFIPSVSFFVKNYSKK